MGVGGGRCVVPPAVTATTEMSSALTKMLDEAKKPTVGRAKNNEIELTIYLPDSNSMEVYVKESCTFGELIRAVSVFFIMSCDVC